MLARVWDRLKQSPDYKKEIAGAASEAVPLQVKAARTAAPYARAAGRALSHPAASALGPALSHASVYSQYEPSVMDKSVMDSYSQASKRAGLARAMELRPQMFAEPHMGPPEPRILLDQEGYVGKKLPGSWDNLPQDPFQKYADMPQRQWEKEMGFGVGEVRRGTPYTPGPFEFWNPPLYFPKSKEDLAAAWPLGLGQVPSHLKP